MSSYCEGRQARSHPPGDESPIKRVAGGAGPGTGGRCWLSLFVLLNCGTLVKTANERDWLVVAAVRMCQWAQSGARRGLVQLLIKTDQTRLTNPQQVERHGLSLVTREEASPDTGNDLFEEQQSQYLAPVLLHLLISDPRLVTLILSNNSKLDVPPTSILFVVLSKMLMIINYFPVHNVTGGSEQSSPFNYLAASSSSSSLLLLLTHFNLQISERRGIFFQLALNSKGQQTERQKVTQ